MVGSARDEERSERSTLTVLLNLGRNSRAMERHEEAKKYSERAIEASPDYAKAIFDLADIKAAMELRREPR